MSNPDEEKRIAELEAENARLRRSIDGIKVRAYEEGNPILHDMALDAIRADKAAATLQEVGDEI